MGHRKSDQAAINKQSNPAATNKQSDPTTTYKRSDLTATGNQAERQWNSLYRLGAIAALFMIAGTLSDLFIGTMSGGDITTIPLTAADRFLQFQSNSLMGLYNLDLLNALTGLIMVPVFIALVAAHRRVNLPYALLSLVVFIIGTSIFVGNNTALPMLELSQKYAAATTDARRIMLESAGEAMLVRGAHGSPGVFLGFALNLVAEIILSLVMLGGKVFGKPTALLGIAGGTLLLAYIVLVTFVPGTKEVAMMIAAPGGLLALAWMILFTIRLFRLSSSPKTATPGSLKL